VTGHFAARYGPDNQLVGSFTLRVNSAAEIPKMMADAVAKVDQLYSQALRAGVLRPDPSLVIEEPLNAVAIDNAGDLDSILAALPSEDGGMAASGGGSYAIQVDTPNAASVGEIQAVLRGLPGVRSAATSSLALGGTSVMQVGFEGPVEQLRAALETRGFSVAVSGSTLRITRRASAAPASPSPGGGGGQ
jgi:hypothetical protein